MEKTRERYMERKRVAVRKRYIERRREKRARKR